MCLPSWEFSPHVQYRIGRADSLRWYRALVLSDMSVYHFRTLFYRACVWSRYRPGVAQRVGRGIALLFHDCGTRWGWVVSSTPRPHFAPGKDPVPIVQEAGWSPGPVWTGEKSRPHGDSNLDRPVRSQSLYRLSYPAHLPCVWSVELTGTRYREWCYTCQLQYGLCIPTLNISEATWCPVEWKDDTEWRVALRLFMKDLVMYFYLLTPISPQCWRKATSESG